LLREFDVYYDQSGTVGKRYAKADEIGVPYCVTIDYETFDDECVTVRFRNDGQQMRIKISELKEKIKEWKKEGKVTL
jgi:glycyl-tRNA synthetase